MEALSLVEKLGRLKKMLEGKVVDDPLIVQLYTREASGIEGSAWAVAYPESISDLSIIASWAYREDVPLYPQGASSDLVGAAVPEGGVVVSFERMRRVREVSIVDSLVVSEPGVRLGDLNSILAEKGYMFPVDPGSVRVATVGGAVNSGAGGMRGAKYGTMRDWTLALTLVLVDDKGSVLRVGCRTLKCRQGYDLVRLIVGSEGTLALVGEAVLRITPLPEATATVAGFFPDFESVAESVRLVRESAIQPLAMEFLDHDTAIKASRAAGVSMDVKGHMVILSVETCSEARDRMLGKLERIMVQAGAVGVVKALSRDMEETLYRVRRHLFPAQAQEAARTGGKTINYIEDIAVPPSRLAEALNMIYEISKAHGVDVHVGGHLADGNLHPGVSIRLDDPAQKDRVSKWYKDIMRMAVRLGGTVSSEHGIGLAKKDGLREELEALGSAKALDIMKAIKRIWDPKGLLNPGKVV